MTDFLRTWDFSRKELEDFVDLGFRFKARKVRQAPLTGKSVGLVFFNPSLRTRASMQVGVYELGGNPIVLEPGAARGALEHREGWVMDGEKTEHLTEFVRVLERYVSVIGVRTFAEMKDWEGERLDPILNAFAKYSSKPVINLESAMHHPCQAMADMMTIHERFDRAKKKVLLTWAWHPKPLPMAVPNSFALAAVQFGHDLTIAHPEGYDLDEELMIQIEMKATESGGAIEITDDVEEAFEGADVVYAKSWGGKQFYGAAEKDVHFRAPLRKRWIVDEEKMARTNNAIFMHCLPFGETSLSLTPLSTRSIL